MAAAPVTDKRYRAVAEQILQLKASIEAARAALCRGTLADVAEPRRPLSSTMQRRGVLTGHFNKVYALDWSNVEQDCLISAGQDGKLIYWNARTRHKLLAITLRNSWVMASTLEPTAARFVACGGLDNICSIYDISGAGEAVTTAAGAVTPAAKGGGPAARGPASRASAELHGHDGYISCVKFVDPGHVITGSGDSTCVYWDVVRRTEIVRFTEHASDVTSLCTNPTDPQVFVTGSVDATAKVWDLRAGKRGKCQMTFGGHDGDVNAVRFLPQGTGFATGSDDACIRIFDLRSQARLNTMVNESLVSSVTSLAFSSSGRVVFGGYDDSNAYGWDVLAPDAGEPAYTLAGHSARVSTLGVNASGQALCTGSWDSDLAIWA